MGKKWEYAKFLWEGGRETFCVNDLNKLGQEGWEVCGTIPVGGHHTTILLKREMK